MSNHGVVAYADTLHHAYMKMETVEHFAQIALVTHLLGRQQPLEGEDLEKLKLARTRYQVASSVLPLPYNGGNNRDAQSNVDASQQENATRPRNKDFRGSLKAKS
jgi:L-fuculose-phosphate aldolase